MKKQILFTVISIILFGCSSDDYEENTTQQIPPVLEFNFDNQKFYNVVSYVNNHYSGWTWLSSDESMNTIISNISRHPNQSEETSDDIFIDVFNSNPIEVGKIYTGSNLSITINIDSKHWRCSDCDGEFVVTEIKDKKISGRFSGLLFNGLENKSITNGVFKNISMNE
ncbi:Uncharacterised protein [Weeksella virosa]|uniref:hypothetical protein n=1 Tax=Weeksella virosa TaxID=1014 RepID=UPI000E05AF91|nr:hypothetical protein [Weeksella virosa]SUP53271.1 Uncharacterised protein [Weeksella virosa]